MIKLKAYTDPGHGWIACKTQLIVELGLVDKLSKFSYIRGKTVYIEEDGDAVKFINALKEKGIEYSIEAKHTNKRSPIRSYDFYDQKRIVP